MAVTIHDMSDKLSWPHKPWCADQRIYCTDKTQQWTHLFGARLHSPNNLWLFWLPVSRTLTRGAILYLL